MPDKEVSINVHKELGEAIAEDRRKLNRIRENIDRCREMIFHPADWVPIKSKDPIN